MGAQKRAARMVSHFVLQLILNAPTVALVGWVAYETVRRFVMREWLSTGFFLHALIALGVVWTLSFVVAQVLIHIAGGARIMKRAFATLRDRTAHAVERSAAGTVSRQMDRVIRLKERATCSGPPA